MLGSLSISNIVLIESLNLEFKPGFTVLTGETGAGKSILLDSLSLVLGERAESRLIRAGENQGSVTAGFDATRNSVIKEILEGQAIEWEDFLVLKRVITADGKSRAFVNGQPISLGTLKKIGEQLVEIHGQHEQTALFDLNLHRSFLDRYGKLQDILREVRESYRGWRKAEEDLKGAEDEINKSLIEEDFLRHSLDELKKLSPEPAEEEELAAKRTILQNSSKITESLGQALAEISGERDVAAQLRSAARSLYRSKFAESNFAEAIAALEKASAEVEEAAAVLERIASGIDSDPNALEKTEDRLFALRAAARKYNRPIAELGALLEEITSKLDSLDSSGKNLESLKKAAALAKSLYIKNSAELLSGRGKAAKKMEQAVEAELKPLKMNNCKFRVELHELPESLWNENGREKITFVAQTNPGMAFAPINKIASGGELSRFMLALRVVLIETRAIPTMIFDEVDSGVGGAVADSVGNRLSKLGKKMQVLVVTHQPQVAAYGDNHLLIAKANKSGKISSNVRELSENERKEELARMLAGATVTEEARAAAHALIAK